MKTIQLDYSGKDINVFMPAFDKWKERNVILNYDKDNFVFDIKTLNGKKIGKISAWGVLNNIENGFYKITQP